jgi:UDP-glucose 4-epimerase
MASRVSGEELNIGSGTEASAREIAERLIKIVGADLEVDYQPDVRVLMSRRVGSNEKARRLLGWEASISIEDGLRTTVDWIRRTS